MRLNADTVIAGERVVLVPYRREHVAKYHTWMQSAELQELTASEPLSLDEEYEMCARWAADADKLTFILLDPARPPDPEQASWPPGGRAGAMAGDVNAFLNDPEDPDTAEVEVMVAEPGSRRRGIAAEAVTLLMAYMARELGTRRFVAKINANNAPSLALFSRLGFAEFRRVDVFEEVHLELRVEGTAVGPMLAAGRALRLARYTAAAAALEPA